jgi:hypothetical protein
MKLIQQIKAGSGCGTKKEGKTLNRLFKLEDDEEESAIKKLSGLGSGNED